MNWRVAKSLDVLLAQINTAFPSRNKAGDGGIGDAAHASRDSDHNPWYPPPKGGVVTARDFTHDPAHGADMDKLSDQLAAGRDRRIKYVIFNRLILDSRPGQNPWKWLPYKGTDSHTGHLHLSVMDNSSCDDPTAWKLPMLLPAGRSTLQMGSRGPEVESLQLFLNRVFPSYSKLVVDGVFGAATDKVVREFQRRSGLTPDGIVGPVTWAKLGF
jgi:hypothetical protein